MWRSEDNSLPSLLPSTLLQSARNSLGRASIVSVLTRPIPGSLATTPVFYIGSGIRLGGFVGLELGSVVLPPCLYYVNFIRIMIYYLYITHVYSAFDPNNKILAAPDRVGV